MTSKKDLGEMSDDECTCNYYDTVYLKRLIYTVIATKEMAVRGEPLDRIYNHLDGLEHELVQLKDMNVKLKRDWWDWYQDESEIPELVIEIIDSYINGMEDEKGIAPKNEEFQERMNHAINILKSLREELIDPSEYIRFKNTGFMKLKKGEDK